MRGPADAPLTLVEYGDLECPFHGRATGAVDELRERFGDRLRYVFRITPMVDAHPHAQLAAEAAEAAAAQGRFWDMHDRLFGAQDRLTTTDLLEHANAIGLDMPRFARDLGSGSYARRVRHDIESAHASGIRGTPTFFIDGRLHTGPLDADTLAAALLANAGDDAASADMTPGAAPPNARADDRRHEVVVMPDLPQDLLETLDRGGDHPRLTDGQLAQLEQGGTRQRVARGDVLYRPGDPGYDFHVVLSGAVAVVGHPRGPEQPVVRVHGARRFLGALDLFDDQRVARTAVVIRAGEVLRVTVDQLNAVFTQDADLRAVVQRAYLVRAAIGYELAADLQLIGRSSSPDTRRLRTWAGAHSLRTELVDLDADDDAGPLLGQLGLTEADLPVVISRTSGVLHNPSDAEVEQALRTQS